MSTTPPSMSMPASPSADGPTPSPSPNRSKAPVIALAVGGCACAVLLVIALVAVIGIVGFGWFRSQEPTPAGPSEETSQTPDPEDLPVTLPPGVTEDQPYLVLGSEHPDEDTPVVDFHLDFLCPHCKRLHEADPSALEEMTTARTIQLRIHPRALLETSSIPNGYSSRAANAAVCAWATSRQSTASWWVAQQALFTHQPDNGREVRDDELIAWLHEAGIGKGVDSCIREQRYRGWILKAVEPSARDQAEAVPAVFVDGRAVSVDPDAGPTPLRTAIEKATR